MELLMEYQKNKPLFVPVLDINRPEILFVLSRDRFFISTICFKILY